VGNLAVFYFGNRLFALVKPSLGQWEWGGKVHSLRTKSSLNTDMTTQLKNYKLQFIHTTIVNISGLNLQLTIHFPHKLKTPVAIIVHLGHQTHFSVLPNSYCDQPVGSTTHKPKDLLTAQAPHVDDEH
jgi:hypothetical protein